MEPSYRYSLVGHAIILKGSLTNEMIEELRRCRASTIILEAGEWHDLSILRELNGRFDNLIVGSQEVDWCAISALSRLRGLEIGGWFRTTMDFSELRELRFLKTYWNEGYDTTLFQLPSLEVLILRGWDVQHPTELKGLKKLRYLELLECRKMVSLDGLDELRNLDGMYLYSLTKLRDIQALSSLDSTVSLTISNCKSIDSYRPLSGMKGLKELIIAKSANIESADFVRDLDRLEYVAIGSGTRIQDGDISPFLDHPALRACRLTKAPHYNYTQKDVEKKIQARQGYLEDPVKVRVWDKPKLQI